MATVPHNPNAGYFQVQQPAPAPATGQTGGSLSNPGQSPAAAHALDTRRVADGPLAGLLGGATDETGLLNTTDMRTVPYASMSDDPAVQAAYAKATSFTPAARAPVAEGAKDTGWRSTLSQDTTNTAASLGEVANTRAVTRLQDSKGNSLTGTKDFSTMLADIEALGPTLEEKFGSSTGATGATGNTGGSNEGVKALYTMLLNALKNKTAQPGEQGDADVGVPGTDVSLFEPLGGAEEVPLDTSDGSNATDTYIGEGNATGTDSGGGRTVSTDGNTMFEGYRGGSQGDQGDERGFRDDAFISGTSDSGWHREGAAPHQNLFNFMNAAGVAPAHIEGMSDGTFLVTWQDGSTQVLSKDWADLVSNPDSDPNANYNAFAGRNTPPPDTSDGSNATDTYIGEGNATDDSGTPAPTPAAGSWHQEGAMPHQNLFNFMNAAGVAPAQLEGMSDGTFLVTWQDGSTQVLSKDWAALASNPDSDPNANYNAFAGRNR